MRFRSPTSLFALAFLLTGCAVAGAAGTSSTRPGASAQPRVVSPAMLAAELEQPIPWRNLYQLTDQLKLHSTAPISRVARTTSPNYPVGHQDSFHVLSEDSNKYFTMQATVRFKTPHLYMYVQNGVKVNMAGLRKAAETFEHHIYPTDRALFGSEWRPGVDGDPHLTCLIGDMRSSMILGAFSAEDEYTTRVNPYSNQREMFYMNTNMTPGSSSFDSTMAHEFQHMIHFHMHPRDNSWTNEGMSMLAEHVNGYHLDGEDQAYIQDPVQLDTWDTDPNSDNFPHYGGGYLFLSYLLQQFGRGMIHTMGTDSRYTDFTLVNDALRKRHIALTGDQVFARWEVANWLDKRSIDGGIYWYPELAQPIRVDTRETSTPFTLAGRIPPYQPRYVVMDSLPSHPFTLSFAAPSTTKVYAFPYSGQFWWSNRGDLSDTRLIRTVDLTGVKHAHLHYKLWYAIEQDYDYGYIEASADGGKTWTTLPAPHTTKSDPFQANYGNAYTGQSKTWDNETVDLSRYVGKRIQIRFEYITDDSVNFQGMAIRSLAIPEIGWKDDGTGWTTRGFVDVQANAVLNPWTVQLIEYRTHGIRVVTMPLAAFDRGSVTIDPAGSGIKRIVAVISSTAPKTTATAPFTLTAK